MGEDSVKRRSTEFRESASQPKAHKHLLFRKPWRGRIDDEFSPGVSHNSSKETNSPSLNAFCPLLYTVFILPEECLICGGTGWAWGRPTYRSRPPDRAPSNQYDKSRPSRG